MGWMRAGSEPRDISGPGRPPRTATFGGALPFSCAVSNTCYDCRAPRRTSPRLRGEGHTARRKTTEFGLVRGRFHKLRLAVRPPHPDLLHSPSKTGVNALMARGEKETAYAWDRSETSVRVTTLAGPHTRAADQALSPAWPGLGGSSGTSNGTVGYVPTGPVEICWRFAAATAPAMRFASPSTR